MKEGAFNCGACRDGLAEPFAFTMAFQPIVDVVNARVFAYEALVRGPQGESAATILGQVNAANRYAFDQQCRIKAITLASRLRLTESGAMLSINFMPGAVYSPAACIQLTLKTASEHRFPLQRLIFEITEAEEVLDRKHLSNIVDEYRKHGFKMALDDFGAGYCGLNLLADFRADFIKLDMELTRNIAQRPAALVIVKHMVQLSRSLGSTLIVEGVETREEYEILRACGIAYMQGYLFARPELEALPAFNLPLDRAAIMAPARELSPAAGYPSTNPIEPVAPTLFTGKASGL